jgi:FkbM family methyltransferase
MRRIGKVLQALATPRYWAALAKGVVPGVEHGKAFGSHCFASVLDVGANKGQFAAFARHRWPQAELKCFEPLQGPRERLASVLGGYGEIHPLALGNYEGEATMHLASREDSSSLLPLGEAQKALFSMDEERVISVPVRRLDNVITRGQLARPALLKIDVQGLEFETLEGATGLLDEIDAIYVECSYIELYSGQKLAPDVVDLLHGFGLIETGRFNICRVDGDDVQADILFERQGL